VTRVVMVAGTYRPERCGTAHYVQRLRHALDERGVSSYVLTAREAARASEDPGVRGAVRGWGTLDLPALVVAVAGLVRKVGADVVHIQHAASTYGFKRAVFFLPPLLRAVGCRVPLVATVHEYGWWEWEPRGVPKGALEAVKTWGQRRGRWDREDGFLLTESDALITTNSHAEAAITSRLPFLASRLYRVPLGANVEVAPMERDEARAALRSRYGWPLEAPVIAFFGFLHPVKGIETLLEAHKKVLAKRPGARLLLVGGVESLALGEEANWYWNELRALIRALGLEGTVAMTGYVPGDEASRLLSGADVGALPFNEGVTLKSGSLLTLFAHGLPVAVTRPDPPEPNLVDGELVRLVERRDASGLTIALLGLLADASERVRLGEAGRAYTRNLSWSSIAERHVEVYESVLEKGARVPAGTGGVLPLPSKTTADADSLQILGGGSTKD
jgi:glycosyltransferase involved in cell wall biosynthesis